MQQVLPAQDRKRKSFSELLDELLLSQKNALEGVARALRAAEETRIYFKETAHIHI